jgi:type II secretory pathway pseudopilin PulG
MSEHGSPVKAPVALETPDAIPEAVDRTTRIAELESALATSKALVQSQSERLGKLSDLEAELAHLKDQHAFVTAAKEAVEAQLKEEAKKREVAEENVELLRGQVEAARRGVGILQKQEKERKRLSQMPTAGLGLVPGENEEVLVDSDATSATKRAVKRQSLIARSHRRTSSQSEPGLEFVPPVTSPNLAAPARTGGLRELRLGSSIAHSTTATSPISGGHFFDDSANLPSAPMLSHRSSSHGKQDFPGSSQSSPQKPSHDELARLRADLAATSAKLVESEEARQASEDCLRALREFMSQGGEGSTAADQDLLKTLKLPPLPTDQEAEPVRANDKKPAGWGFKLWKQGPTSPSLSTTVEPPATPATMPSPSITPRVSPLPQHGDLPTEQALSAVPSSATPLSSFVGGWTKTVQPGTPADRPPAGRSLSNFFSRTKTTDKLDKELPPQPEDTLEPSPSIPDKVESTDKLNTDDKVDSSGKVDDNVIDLTEEPASTPNTNTA